MPASRIFAFLRRHDVWFLSAGLVLAVFLAFGRSLAQGFAPLDDALLIGGNLVVRGITPQSLRLAFTTYDPELYIPLTLVSFQVNYLLSALNPFTYHLVNLLLHAGNTLLVAWLLFLLTGRKAVAFFCALLFAVHPLHTEAVVWIAGRKDLLSTFFFLLSFLAYLFSRSGKRGMLTVSLALFLCALLSKVMAATLPLVLILSDVFLEKRKPWRAILWDKIPYLLLSVVFVLVAMAGKERILASSTPAETFLMAGKSSVFYLQKLVLPLQLSVFYPFRGTIGWGDGQFLIPWLIIAGLLGIAFAARKKHPLVAFGILFFLGTLAPTFLQFRKGDSIFFAVDRYAYLPSIGILALLAGVLVILPRVMRVPREVPWILGTVVTALFLVVSMAQTRVWDGGEQLFSHALGLYPASVEARTAWAQVMQGRGETGDAFTLLKNGLPYGDDVRLRLGAARIYALVGKVADAEEQCRLARALDPENPDPFFVLGALQEQTRREDEALQSYLEAVRLDESFVGARAAAAELLMAEGRDNEAEEQLRAALRWNPSSVEALTAMAELLEERKEPGAGEYREKLRLLNASE